jgi:hypothetical protein
MVLGRREALAVVGAEACGVARDAEVPEALDERRLTLRAERAPVPPEDDACDVREVVRVREEPLEGVRRWTA